MITATGKAFIKRYMAGQAGQMVGALAIGISDTAATTADTRLGFEFARIPVDVIAYDFVNDRLVFKGSLPAEVEGKIHEVGIWSTETNPQAGNQGSRTITTFDSATETWTNSAYDTVNVRIGPNSLKHTPAASASTTSTLSGLTMEFADNSSADTFLFAYNVENSFTASIKVRFAKDATNYYEFTISAPTSGYKITALTKGSATAVGVPAWDEINEITVITTSTSGGASAVEFDGIRIEDVDTVSPEYGLIARFVPVTPINKEDGSIQDFEYTLTVSV